MKKGTQTLSQGTPEGSRAACGANAPWNTPEMVARLSATPPNARLMHFAAGEWRKGTGNHLLDIGCGAGCNAIPLAQAGWNVAGIDLSEPMLAAARQRANEGGQANQLHFKQAAMDHLPLADNCCDFIVAHGIWNLARSANEFRAAIREAARVAKPGAPLFVYTFARSTLPPDMQPLPNETFIFAEPAGQPRCFLTQPQLRAELDSVGFVQEQGCPITEYPRQPDSNKPAILEGIFRLSS